MTDPVAYRSARGVATVTLTDPEARNVLTPDSLALLEGAFELAERAEDVRVIVLTGEGNTFCAGANLRGAAAAEDGSFAARAPAHLAALLRQMVDCPKPIVGRVQGHVAGGGNGLVAACDVVVAADHAKFAFSEVRVGVAPAVIATVCLRRMPAAQAAELFLTGERITAERAAAAGLVHRVVDLAGLDRATQDVVDALLLGGPVALGRTKELLSRLPGMSREEAFAWTAELSAELFASEEAAEGMGAFLERRRPSWCRD